jgi:hypothetical protein
MTATVREVEDSARDEERGAVGTDVTETNCQGRLRSVNGECNDDLGEPEDFEFVIKRPRRRAQGKAIFATAVRPGVEDIESE